MDDDSEPAMTTSNADARAFTPSALQLAVRDVEYPRNRLIRAKLEERGWEVKIVTVGGGGYMHRVRNLLRSARAAGRTDVVVCAELGIQYAWVGWLIAKLWRAVYCVDYFVGMYETNVSDWGEVSGRSITAFKYKLFDYLAVKFADVLVSDTEIRAQEFGRRARRSASVYSLPVGAPKWAHPLPRIESAQLELLFYGSYLPLHGIDVILRAFSAVIDDVPARLKIVGEGPLKPEMQELAAELRIKEYVTFSPQVPESSLPGLIQEAHVVLGVFGSSTKASSVIPNKVWQGLSCERYVVTRVSPALNEIGDIAAPWLVQVPAGEPQALADALTAIGRYPETGALGTRQHLDKYVDEKYRPFLDELTRRVRPARREVRHEG